MSDTSLWTALRNPVFRRLWMASAVSGVCVAAHDTAATGMMNTLTSSMFLISVMSTVASLPFFLFTLPAGSLADMVDRKKLLCTMNWSLDVRPDGPVMKHFISVNRELLGGKRPGSLCAAALRIQAAGPTRGRERGALWFVRFSG